MTSFNELTGLLDRTQFPDAMLTDGTRPLTGNLSVAAGVTIDGVDISSFNSFYQAHLIDPQSHGYVRSILDDASSPVTRDPITNDVRIYGADGISVTKTEAGLRIAGGGGPGGPSGGTVGMKDPLGNAAIPDSFGYLNFSVGAGLSMSASGSTLLLSLNMGTINHASLGGIGKHDHHTAFTGLVVGVTNVSPNGSDRIELVAGSNMVVTPSSSKITFAVTATPIFTSMTVNGNVAVGGLVDGVDVALLKSGFDLLSSDFSSHDSSTAEHGATGAVVGTTNTQTLTNKTLALPIIGDFTNAQHTHQAAATGGKLDHGLALNGLGDDDHTQYVHTSVARTITASHSFSPSTASAPFALGANAQGQTVVGLRADQLNKSVSAGTGLSGGGALTSDVTLNVNLSHTFAWTADHTWSGKIGFGSVTRQMIDLYGTVYGVGVQASTAYIRTNKRFSVHLNGTHSNTENEPGSGGTVLFTVTTSLIEYKGSTIWHAANDGTGSGLDADLWDGYQFSDYLNQAVKSTSSPTFAALTVNGLITATATGENMRLRYDANNYASFTVGTANLTLGVRGNAGVIGSLTLDVANVYPYAPLSTSLGSNIQKYLTLHAAELWVDTLVAQDKIATIGGRILVGPTTTLTRDMLAASTYIYVKHNHLASGDFVYLEGSGKLEFIKINSIATTMAEGDYRYTVLRNQDATGANDWYSGDAVFNTGTTNDGWIDMYAISSMAGASQTGPTIVGNVRTGNTWNMWEPRWAVGNLNGIYGYGAATYGAAFGSPSTTNVTIDNVNGFRVRKNGTTLMSSWDTSGNIVLGDTGFEHITISTSTIQIKDGSNVYTSLTGGSLSLGLVSTGDYVTIDGTNGVRIYNNATVSAHWKANGNLVIGEVANSRSRIEITSGAINIINRSAGGVDVTSISLSNSGSASFTGTITALAGSITGALTLGESGGIYQGNGTFASPATGLKIWSDAGVGRIAGYNASTIQWYAGTDGRLYAGAGNVKLDQDGLTILGGGSSWSSVSWVSSSGTMGNVYGSEVTGPPSYVGLGISVTPNPTYKAGMAYLETTHYDDFPVAGFYQSRASVTVRSDSASVGSVTLHASSVVINTSSTTTNQRALFGAQGTILNGWVRGNQAGNSLRIDTGTGYIDIGARNTSWAHFYTDRANFYFDVPIHVNNSLSSYNNNLLLQRAGSTKLTLTSSGASVTGDLLVSGDVKNLINLDANTIYGGDSWSTLSSAAHLGKSLYTQSLSSYHLISMFSDAWSHLSAIAFGAYPVAPKPVASGYLATGNMRYLGGSYGGVTQAGIIAFAGNGGRFYFRTSQGGLANHADIEWTDIMSVGTIGLDVLGAITGSSFTTTGAITGSYLILDSTTQSIVNGRFTAKSGVSGAVGLVPGTANDPGYVEWHQKNGTTRIGYMGWSTGGENNLAIVLENSAQLRVIGGNMGINADPGSYRLRVNGNTYFEGNQVVTGNLTVTGTLVVNGYLELPDGGTVLAPSNCFEGDSNTGFYRWAGDSWSLVAGGVSLISMTSTSIDLKEELGDWTALTLSTGWSNYGGSSYSIAQYKRVGDLVFLRGLVTCAAWSTTPIIATMPAGFRPLRQAMFVCAGNTSGSSVRIDVEAGGGLRWLGGGAGNGWISLDNIIFSIK